jgi:hypothetical protein
MCRSKCYTYRKFSGVFSWGVEGGYEQGSKEKKGTFTRLCRFFLFLKFIFDRIFISPVKKRWGYLGLLLSVRSFVHPVVTLFRLSDTIFNFARTGVPISER